jgi:hypothetical protein
MDKNENQNQNQNEQNDMENLSDEKLLELYQDVLMGPEQLFDEKISYTSKWAPGSDRRIKNIKGDNKAGLKEISSLNIVDYTYKFDKNNTPHVGVIAQELQEIFPNSVFEDKTSGYLRITTEEMFFAMINAIKELSQEVNTLKSELKKLK